MNSSMDLTKLTYFDCFKSTGGVMSQLISHKKNPLTSLFFLYYGFQPADGSKHLSILTKSLSLHTASSTLCIFAIASACVHLRGHLLSTSFASLMKGSSHAQTTKKRDARWLSCETAAAATAAVNEMGHRRHMRTREGGMEKRVQGEVRQTN